MISEVIFPIIFRPFCFRFTQRKNAIKCLGDFVAPSSPSFFFCFIFKTVFAEFEGVKVWCPYLHKASIASRSRKSWSLVTEGISMGNRESEERRGEVSIGVR